MFQIARQTDIGLPGHADVQGTVVQGVILHHGYLGVEDIQERLLGVLDLIDVVRDRSVRTVPHGKSKSLPND